MSPINILVLGGIFAIAGQWAQGKLLPFNLVIGLVVAALLIGGLSQFNSELATAFAILFTVAVILTQGYLVFQKMGLVK